jgi:hypothetical protein
VDWVPAVIAVIAAAVSVWGAWKTTAETRRRHESRQALGTVIDAGNRLLDAYKKSLYPANELDLWYEAWEDDASSAVDEVDIAQHGRYHGDIPHTYSREEVIAERIRRLQEILNRQ